MLAHFYFLPGRAAKTDNQAGRQVDTFAPTFLEMSKTAGKQAAHLKFVKISTQFAHSQQRRPAH